MVSFKTKEFLANSTYTTDRTPWAIQCSKHKTVYLTEEGYQNQMWNSNAIWRCPICSENSSFDDDNYAEWLDYEERQFWEKRKHEQV